MMKWKSAGGLLGLMFLNYGLNAFSFRMLAQGNYLGVGVSDALVAWYGFTMVQNVAKANTVLEKIGYTCGGILGSLFGLWLTT